MFIFPSPLTKFDERDSNHPPSKENVSDGDWHSMTRYVVECRSASPPRAASLFD